jgi:hypothetical protein
MVSNGKSTRNADLRHAQSIGRQRNAAQRAAADVSLQELADILPHDTSPMLPDAAPVSTPATEAPANMPRPSWRDYEPPIVHRVKWWDSDHHEHLHIVRGDDLDEVLLHLKKVKAVIAAARARTGVGDALAAGDAVPTCPDHRVPMRSSKKYGGYYCTRKTPEGVYCTRKVKDQ